MDEHDYITKFAANGIGIEIRDRGGMAWWLKIVDLRRVWPEWMEHGWDARNEKYWPVDDKYPSKFFTASVIIYRGNIT